MTTTAILRHLWKMNSDMRDIVISDGTVIVSAGGDGLVAATDITIKGGNIGSTAVANGITPVRLMPEEHCQKLLQLLRL